MPLNTREKLGLIIQTLIFLLTFQEGDGMTCRRCYDGDVGLPPSLKGSYGSFPLCDNFGTEVTCSDSRAFCYKMRYEHEYEDYAKKVAILRMCSDDDEGKAILGRLSVWDNMDHLTHLRGLGKNDCDDRSKNKAWTELGQANIHAEYCTCSTRDLCNKSSLKQGNFGVLLFFLVLAKLFAR